MPVQTHIYRTLHLYLSIFFGVEFSRFSLSLSLSLWFCVGKSCHTIRLPLEYGTLDRPKIVFLLNTNGKKKNFAQKNHHITSSLAKRWGERTLNTQQHHRTQYIWMSESDYEISVRNANKWNKNKIFTEVKHLSRESLKV